MNDYENGNVFFKQSEVFLYSRYDALKISLAVRDALRGSKGDWSLVAPTERRCWADAPCLARLVFCEMTRSTPDYFLGISHKMIGNALYQAVLVVDTVTETVTLTAADGPDADPDDIEANATIGFGAFIGLSDNQVRAWHLSKSYLQPALWTWKPAVSAAIPLSAQDLFDHLLPEALSRQPARARQLDTILCFKIVGDGGGTWTIDCLGSTPAPTCLANGGEGARCTVEVGIDDFRAMLADPKFALQLYHRGQLRLSGNPQHAPKIAELFALVSA